MTAMPLKVSGSAPSDSTTQTPDEQPLSKRRDVPLGTHKLRKLLPAWHRGGGRNGRGRRPS